MSRINEAARDASAKAIADVIGHGMREKCSDMADAALEAALPYMQPSPAGQGDARGQFEALSRRWTERAERLEEDAREADSIGDMPNTVLVLERRSTELRQVIRELEAALATRQPVTYQHPDDLAVDAFAAAMKAKMAEARARGRGGWEDRAQCSADDLSRMLRDHVKKGDPRDVANFCMMLHQRGEAIAARQPVGAAPNAANFECLINALHWYKEQAELCKKIGREGESGRHALDRDGGSRAKAALELAPRPSDDALWDQTLEERDRYHEVADELASHIERITGVEIGEHSSANCPWQNAIEAAEEFVPARAVDLGRARDSECYRWLRDHYDPSVHDDDGGSFLRQSGEELDAAIDSQAGVKP